MNNTAIWDKVKKTDPNFTKDSSFGRKTTSISPMYQIQEATKVFGPYGKGWGFESCDLDLSHLETLNLVLVKAVFFYIQDGERSSFVINNSWPIKIIKKKGCDPVPDDDFAKKAETNTMSKALSRLGFSADIFMGQFEDHEYKAMLKNEINLENAEDKIEEARKQQDEYESKCAKEIEFIASATSINELQKLYTDYVRRAKLHKDNNHITTLTAAKDKRKGEL